MKMGGRTFCVDGSVLHLCCPVLELPSACSYQTCKMWLVQMKYLSLLLLTHLSLNELSVSLVATIVASAAVDNHK